MNQGRAANSYPGVVARSFLGTPNYFDINKGEIAMTNKIDLQSVAEELGPKFAKGAAERDADATFVAAHYALLKDRKPGLFTGDQFEAGGRGLSG
ncbi:MAG: hypothetical protein WD005_01030, partial [Haliea sp.]